MISSSDAFKSLISFSIAKKLRIEQKRINNFNPPSNEDPKKSAFEQGAVSDGDNENDMDSDRCTGLVDCNCCCELLDGVCGVRMDMDECAVGCFGGNAKMETEDVDADALAYL